MTDGNKTKIQNIKEMIDKIHLTNQQQEIVCISDYMHLITNCCLVVLSQRYHGQPELIALLDLRQIVNHLCNRRFRYLINTITDEGDLFNMFKVLPGGMLIFHKQLTIHATAMLQIPEKSQTEIIKLANLTLDQHNSLKKTLKDKLRIVFDDHIQYAQDKLKAIGLFDRKIGEKTIFANLKSHDMCELHKLFTVDISIETSPYDRERVDFYILMANLMQCNDVDEFRYIAEFTQIKLNTELSIRVKRNSNTQVGPRKSLQKYYQNQIVGDALWHDIVINKLIGVKSEIDIVNNQSTLKFAHWLTAAYHYEKHASGVLYPDETNIPTYFEKARKITEGSTENIKSSQDGSLRIYQYSQGDFVAIKHERINDGKTYIATFYNKNANKFRKLIRQQKQNKATI